jgi:glucose 1-dehydrogenase
MRDKVVVVTGATSGVARAIALTAAARGAHVVATGATIAAGETLEAAADSLDGSLRYVCGETRSSRDCRRAVKTAVASFGRLDVVVNAIDFIAVAGATGMRPRIGAVSEESWDDVLDTHMKSAFLLSREAVRQFLSQGQGGLVLHIASSDCAGAYEESAPSKAAIAGLIDLSRSLSDEYWDEAIRSNTVLCASSVGPTIRTAHADAPLRAPSGLGAPSRVPREPSSFDEIAQFLMLLCDDASAILTGATIEVGLPRARASNVGVASSAPGDYVHHARYGLN